VTTAAIPVYKKCKPVFGHAGRTESRAITVVGTGPVGLTAALDLALKGHAVTVLGRLDFIPAGSKAICFAKRTLEIWDRLGVAGQIVSEGVQWDTGKVFWGDRRDPIYQFDLRRDADQKAPSFVNIPQYRVEEILVDQLAQLGNVELRWGHEVVLVTPRDDGVTIDVRGPDGFYQIASDWLIACDGSKSPVRTMLGLDFDGRVFEDNFLIADIRIEQEQPAERWFWFDPPFNPGRSALLHKQPGNVWRLDFQLGWDIDRAVSTRPEMVDPLVRGLIGADTPFEREWYSVYTFQCRRMRNFVHDRVIFAGDSAHLVSPFGARGCNGGIADIDNLGWKLDLVISGNAPQALLASYDREATAAADENILNSSRSTDFLTPKSRVSAVYRDAVLALAEHADFARAFVNSGRLSTAISHRESPLNTPDSEYWQGGIAPGAPAQDMPLGYDWLLESLGDNFVLLCNGYDKAVPRGIRKLDLAAIDGDTGNVAAHYQLAPGAAYLIRPDQHVAARWRMPTRNGIDRARLRATGALP
jgi:3-(3-hydroxy-phenyl)propionate hydroxylase